MKTIRAKMLVHFGGVLLLVLLVFGVVMYRQTRDAVVPLTKRLSQEILQARSDEMGRLIAGYLRDIQAVTARVAVQAGEVDAIIREMRDGLAAIDGADYEMWFFADAAGDYITSERTTGHVSDRAYFQAVVRDGAPFYISQPLISRASGDHVFVVACPVVNDEGERIGMVGATVLLETLSSIAAEIQLGGNGFGYVVGDDGLLIAHPSSEWRLNLSLLDSDRYGFENLADIGRLMMAGDSGFATYKRPDGSSMVAVFHPIQHSPGWALGLAIYEDEMMGPARALVRTVAWLMAGIAGAVLLVVWIVSGGLSSPIHALYEGVKTVGTGQLDKPLDIRTGDEIEALASAFNKMQIDLTSHIETLQRTTAEKERIERDLHVANKIQSSMLPRTFPPYPDIANLELYASMDPAREVGGDFYDFFLIDDRRLCFGIGDVSGKGVSAALFMVITRTILKNQALSGNSLPEIMRRTNDMLCAENDENMFVTIFMGVLDVVSGDVEYVCAGHNPPLISRGGEPFRFLDVQPSIVVGGVEDAAYASSRIKLAPGDLLFLYTDGVTEAMNSREELFGDQRMISAANASGTRDARELVRAMRTAVDRFVEETPASDDVTMLAVGLSP